MKNNQVFFVIFMFTLLTPSPGDSLISLKNNQKVFQPFIKASLGTPIPFLTQNSPFKVAISPDGNFLAVGRDNADIRNLESNKIILWTLATKRILFEFSGHKDFVHSLSFSPDNNFLVSASRDATIRIWDLRTGKEKHFFKYQSLVIFFADNGKKLVWANKKGWIYFCDFPTGGNIEKFFTKHKTISAIALNGRSELMATCGDENETTIRVWKFLKKEQIQKIKYSENVKSLCFSPKESLLGICNSKKIEFFNFAKSEIILQIKNSGSLFESICWCPDGKTLISTSFFGELRFWDCPSGLELTQYRFPFINSFTLGLKGKILITTDFFGKIRFWDLEKIYNRKPFMSHQSLVSALSFSPDKHYLISGSIDGKIFLWNPNQGKLIKNWSVGKITELSFSPTEKKVSIGDWEGIKIFSIPEGCFLNKVNLGKGKPGLAFSFSPKGNLLAFAGEENNVNLINLKNGEKEVLPWPILKPKTYPTPRSLAFSYDGKELFVNYLSGQIYSWNLIKRKPELNFVNKNVGLQSKLVSNSNGIFVAAQAPNEINILKISRNKVESVIKLKETGPCIDLVIFFDGRTLATSGKGILKFWEIGSGRLIKALKKPEWGEIRSLGISSNNQMLAFQAEDFSILVIDLPLLMKDKEPVFGDIPSLWKGLEELDPSIAHKCLWELVFNPQITLDFIKKKLQPIPPLNSGEVNKLIKCLESDSFFVRDKATKQMKELGELVEDSLKNTVKKSLSPEVRRRAEKLLESLSQSQKKIFNIRVIQLLENIGNDEAYSIVQELGKGNPKAWLTKEAARTLKRKKYNQLSQKNWIKK